MKVSIEKRTADVEGKRALRLVYYFGVTTDEEGKSSKKRSREPLNLFIYDKPRTPEQRAHNKEVMRIAEAIRAKRMLESETGKHKIDDRTKLSACFLEYYDKVAASKIDGSVSNYSIWQSAAIHLRSYAKRPLLAFDEVDKAFLEGFRAYLLNEVRTKSNTPLSRNTASSYFNKIRAALNQAQVDGIIYDNPARQTRSIPQETNQRTYLTLDEVRALARAECRYEVLKRAFLFSCTTGLRWSDIQKLLWEEVEEFEPGHLRIIFKQQKLQNKGNALQYLDLPDSAVRLTHVPTGIVVQCQNDRSQHRNRDEAWQMLRARLYEFELRKQQAEQQKLEDAKSDIGWGHQIRSYVLDQSRIKDLRTNHETGNTQAVLDGDLDPFIEASLKQGV